MIKFV